MAAAEKLFLEKGFLQTKIDDLTAQYGLVLAEQQAAALVETRFSALIAF